MKAWEVAVLEYDTSEVAGIVSNPRILEYSKEIGATWVNDETTAWCAIFVQWCLKQAGKPFSYMVNARYFLNYGIKTESPELGDIVVLWRNSQTSLNGHVGFFIKKNKNYVWILGGNQNDEVNISPFPLKQVLEYRKILDK